MSFDNQMFNQIVKDNLYLADRIQNAKSNYAQEMSEPPKLAKSKLEARESKELYNLARENLVSSRSVSVLFWQSCPSRSFKNGPRTSFCLLVSSVVADKSKDYSRKIHYSCTFSLTKCQPDIHTSMYVLLNFRIFLLHSSQPSMQYIVLRSQESALRHTVFWVPVYSEYIHMYHCVFSFLYPVDFFSIRSIVCYFQHVFPGSIGV